MNWGEWTLPLARALAHSLWQGPILWLAWLATRRLLRGHHSAARYHAALLALVLLVLLPLLTLFGARSWLALPSLDGSAAAGAAAAPPLNLLTRQLDLHLTSALGGAVAGLWLLGTCLQLGRILLGLWRLRRPLTEARPVLQPVLVHDLARRLGVAVPRVVESARARSPFVSGIVNPVLVLPPGLSDALSPAELEAVLLHELGHLRRADLRVNLALSVLAAFAWYQWPLRRLFRELQREREQCCDELALDQTGRPLALARALVSLEERRGSQPLLVLAGTGGDLSSRVHRILAWNAATAGGPGRPRALAAAAGLFWIVAAATGLAGSAEAAWFTMPVSITAADPAGPFTVELVGERLVAATVAGREVPPEEIVQRGRVVALRDPTGGPELTLEVRRGGIRWQARPPRRR